MTPRIQRAIDIFLDAINNGTLAKGTPCGCAIGNLVAYYNNISLPTNLSSISDHCEHPAGKWFIYEKGINEKSKLLDPLEFSIKEIIEIEAVFEKSCKISFCFYPSHSPKETREDQIKGLEAVVRLMLTFDEQKDEVKEVFTKKAELIPV